MSVDQEPVPRVVLDAFGLPHAGGRLPGGQGRSFRHGEAVLKAAEDPAEAAWAAQLLAALEPRGYRLARPLRASDGRWVIGGWTACEYLDAQSGPAGRWEELLDAGRAFHVAIAHVPRPAFLARRSHRWARADRAAWGERDVTMPVVARARWSRLAGLLEPVSVPAQLVHGDLSGNVLFAEGELPAIIDFSPYWRPVGYAEAIVVVDALLWFGADRRVLVARADTDGFAQMLVRALMFRLVALTEGARDDGSGCLSELSVFDPVIDTLERVISP